MLRGTSGVVPKTDVSIATFLLPSILCPFTSITSLHASMEGSLFENLAVTRNPSVPTCAKSNVPGYSAILVAC
jgi:hypothetical protein